MRSNEEIVENSFDGLKDFMSSDLYEFYTLLIFEAMKEAQKEIVEYVLQKAAENATVESEYLSDAMRSAYWVDERSILSLKDEIIKEIENGNNV